MEVFVVELLKTLQNITFKIANLARKWIHLIAVSLAQLVCHLLNITIRHLRQESQHFFDDTFKVILEVLDQEALELKQLLNNNCHSLELLLTILATLVKQVQSVNDADCAVDFLHLNVVLVNEIADLALEQVLAEVFRLGTLSSAWDLWHVIAISTWLSRGCGVGSHTT